MAPASHHPLIRDHGWNPPPVQGSGLPLGHLPDDLVGDPTDGVLGDLGVVDISEVGSHLPGGQTTCSQRQHDLVHPNESALPLPDDLRLEGPVPIPRDIQLDRPDLRHHRLGSGAIARVLAVPADRVVLVVTQVLDHLALEHCFQDVLGQTTEQATRPDQINPFGLGLIHQPLGQLLHLILIETHGLDRVGHDPCFLPISQLACRARDQLHR